MMPRLAVLCFVLVAGAMNALFALTLGSDPLLKGCWLTVSAGATLYTAHGLEAVAKAWRAREWTRCLAAFVLLIPAVGYDSLAAYGLAHRELDIAAKRVQEATREREKAERRVTDARLALSPYLGAGDPEAEKAKLAALERRGLRNRDHLNKVEAARFAVANAEARVRLAEQLKLAEEELARVPPPPPADFRASLIGAEFLAWLPVILIQLGCLLGIYATGRSTAKTSPPPRQIVASPNKPIPNVVKLVATLAADPSQAPEGVTVDGGWVKAGQRRLAALARMPLARFNREMKAAVASGLLLLNTADGTALKLAGS